ncbi:MAG: lipoprotein [Spiroplasma phoeniceum]|nr:MAG: lipoprotein [Spiroplasma phoeniceum]UZQ32479.1 MAG: lipoprotein [Spiroplasma phoeniceum]
MKKLLSILGTIGLTATSTTTLISCEKPNNNKTGGGNKPEPTPEPQQPPKNSKWKLMSQATTNKLSHPNYLNIADNKNYIFIYNNNIPKNYKIIKIINDGFDYPSNIFKFVRDNITAYSTYWNAIMKTSYCWNGVGEPTTPTIDKDTGEITDWKK